MQVRLAASAGSNTSGRGCGPTCRSPARRTAAPRTPCRPRCCARAARPRCRGSRPGRSACRWSRSRNCQPSTSSEPASPANSAADRHHDDVVAADRDARRPRRLGVEADRADLEAERVRFRITQNTSSARERDEQADVQALQLRVAPEHRQLRARRRCRWRPATDCVGCRSAAGRRGRTGTTPTQIAIQLSMIVVITSLAPVVAFSTPAIPPTTAPRGAGRDRCEHDVQERSACPSNDEPTQTADERADEVLALAADVEQAAAERERDRQAGEDQRRRHDQRLLQVQRRDGAVLGADPREEPVQPGAVEDRLVGRDRVVAR